MSHKYSQKLVHGATTHTTDAIKTSKGAIQKQQNQLVI